MSGTSADGVDVAVVSIQGRGSYLSFDLLVHDYSEYPKAIRQAVLAAMNASKISVAELSRLNFRLGEFYADAVRKAQKKAGSAKLDLVGCHGQTLYHQGAAAPYLGKKIACTWQTGEGAVVAARLEVPVVSDFRPADMAAGGKGAPLVPLLDYVIFHAKHKGRIVQNIGGIANLTAMAAGAGPGDALAFDTGPGNMVIDQLMQLLFNKPYDRGGAVARGGTILQPVLEELLGAPYFKLKPPKTAGREEFGRRICRGIFTPLRQGRQSGRDCHGNGAHGRLNGAGAAAFCFARGKVPRLGRLRRRNKERHADEHAPAGSLESGTQSQTLR